MPKKQIWNEELRNQSGNDLIASAQTERGAPTVFALGDVAAFVAALRVGGIAPGPDAIPVGVPAVVQLQAVGG